jgi:signal transduction histidine kinase
MRMTRIIEQLLDVTHARLGTGIPVERRDTQLQPVAETVVEELALAYPKQRFELRGDVDVHGMWDPDRLGQVISNLSSNAVQYGRVGEPIVIEVARTPTTATIAVTNAVRTAPIAPEAIATLFEPYRRGATAGYAQGLGLGLYIVHEIVRAHRGHIDVVSTTAGTTFRVVLPLVAEE